MALLLGETLHCTGSNAFTSQYLPLGLIDKWSMGSLNSMEKAQVFQIIGALRKRLQWKITEKTTRYRDIWHSGFLTLCMYSEMQISVSDSSQPPEQPLVSRMINTTQDRQHVISGLYLAYVAA